MFSRLKQLAKEEFNQEDWDVPKHWLIDFETAVANSIREVIAFMKFC